VSAFRTPSAQDYTKRPHGCLNEQRRFATRVQRFCKNVLDYFLAALLFPILSPVLLICAIAIRLDSKGPIIYCQRRVGEHGRLFTIYKLRTMVVGAERKGLEIRHGDPRITRVGHILRLTSLDELPQLLNILKGEMSLIGPRPLLPGTLRPDETLRQSVKPGMASYQDLFGRQTLDWETRIKLDLWYVRNWSLWLDVKITVSIIPIVLSCRNVYDDSGGSRPRFKAED
jgi:undecaprenyl phosphate N,N'-diacetylbacillosamine 1-phosphate transferase